jgi:glycosyltransferase involved in cell wall biosynthesis
MSRRIKILVIAPSRVSERMAGPNIRAIALARELADRYEVTLAVPDGSTAPTNVAFRVRTWNRSTILRWLPEFDVVVSRGTEYPARGCVRSGNDRPVQVFDLSDPILFELQASRRGPPTVSDRDATHLRHLTAFLLRRTDYVLCASERQRDLWLGSLYVLRRPVNRAAETGAERIGVVPFGHEQRPPVRSGPAVKGVHAGIGASDKLLLWNGGLWRWLDPVTLIRAMPLVLREEPRARLFFMGTGPAEDSTSSVDPELSRDARAAAEELSLLNRAVFFNDDWVPFEQRGNFLLDADVIVCASRSSLESRFAFRSRLVDAFWAGVPIVSAGDDCLSELVERHGFGRSATPEDPRSVAERVIEALRPATNDEFRRSLHEARNRFTWERCVEPLRQFCERVASGDFVRDRDSGGWRPWTDYLRYKVPSLASRLGPAPPPRIRTTGTDGVKI